MACKTTSRAGLSATSQQMSNVKTCIIETIKESYADFKPDMAAIEAFAQDLMSRAPQENDTVKDYAFESYATDYGCNPNEVGRSANYGTMIVGEWAVSPLNPANPKDPTDQQ